MNTRWDKLNELFFAALDCEASQRSAFLDKACGDDRELREELESMLAVEEDTHALALESRLLSNDASNLGPETLIGTRIGPYRLEKLIGEGGMGEVYLADRDDDQYQQKVALKLVRPGYRNVELLTRFRVERQVLARLNHPNITRLLDGGIDNEGRPYLVMQFIEGLPITKFCDKNGLSIDERLALFSKVCDAVHYAHRNLVVHRDLKPSNILVTEEGVVKLLDFGIAKLLSPESEGVSIAITRSQIRLMTPEYAAPEQVKGEVITTATDVYALGVLLYEMLTGRRPYKLDKRLQAEVERIICEEDPQRPSTAVTDEAAPQSVQTILSTEAISRARRTGVKRLRKMLQGDLDNLVLMALRKEPERRYASAEQFALDIQRYLREEPLLARPSTMGYRLRKYLKRHRVGVGAAGLVLLSLIGGLGLALYQAQKTEQQRDRAERALEQSEEVATFLMGLFQANSPSEARGDTLTAQDLLERGVERAIEIKGQPEVYARMLDVIGQSYLSLGKSEKAQPLLEAARETWMQLGNTPETARTMRHLAGFWIEQREMEKGDSLLTEAMRLLQNTEGVSRLDWADAFYARASYFYDLADYPKADSIYRRVLAIRENRLGADHPSTLRTVRGLAITLEKQGHYDEAEALYRRALAGYQATYGDVHIEIARVKDYLSTLLYQRDEFDEAVQLSEESVALSRKIYPADHPKLGVRLGNHAKLLISRERRAEAEPLLDEAAALFKAAYGSQNADYAWVRQVQATNLMNRQAYEEATEIFEEVTEIHRATLGESHPRLGTTLLTFGSLESIKGNYDAAELRALEALDIYKRVYGDQHLNVATAYSHLTSHALGQKHIEKALIYVENGIEIYHALFPDGHVRIATALNLKGRILLEQGQAREAIALFQEAIDMRTPAFGADHWLVGQIRNHLGAGFIANNQPEEGGIEFTQAYRNYEAANRWNGEMKQILERLESYHAMVNQADSVRFYAEKRKARFPDSSNGE